MSFKQDSYEATFLGVGVQCTSAIIKGEDVGIGGSHAIYFGCNCGKHLFLRHRSAREEYENVVISMYR